MGLWAKFRPWWWVLVVLLGGNLWAVLSLAALQVEWLDPQTRLGALLLYLMPLGLLGLVGLLRSPWLTLLAFPASLLPVVWLLPEADKAVLEGGPGFFSLAVSLLLYVGAGARWHVFARTPAWLLGLGETLGLGKGEAPLPVYEEEATLEPVAQPTLRRNLWWPYRWHFLPRWFLLLGLLCVWVYGLNFHEDVALRMSEGFAEQAAQAQVLFNLLFFFVWMVVAYLFFFAPGLHLELEQRAQDAKLVGMEGSWRPWAKVVLWSLGAIASLAGLLWWTGGAF